jgi:hypothetical protein
MPGQTFSAVFMFTGMVRSVMYKVLARVGLSLN